MNKVFMTQLATLVLTASALFAGNLPLEETHIQAGIRMQHPTKTIAVQEERALFSKCYPDADSVEQEEKLFVESASLTGSRISPDSLDDVIKEAETSDLNAICAKVYHPASAHFLISRSYIGDTLELHDGSIWVVKHSDRHTTAKWQSDHVIRIVPNTSWFSNYQFKLVNIATGESVRTNLSLGPIYNGMYTYWITGIDYTNRLLCLNDGSVWNMSGFDGEVFANWLNNDTIIIGTNDGWFSGSRPNILLNVNMLNYVKARCDY